MYTVFLSLYIFVLMLGSYAVPDTVSAAATDFNVRTIVGGDTEAPTTPGNFGVTPIATSQTNLSWDASTDDFILSGYHIWRDGVRIATTTATLYADTGLTANTLYTYYVTAYDSFFNESASSTIESTTTLSIPPPEPEVEESGSQTGSRITPFNEMIVSIEVLPQKDSVVIRYVTEANVRSIIKWGKTSSYELGSLAERTFGMSHETRIVGLIPGTLYSFVIEGENKLSRYGALYEGFFTTLPPEDTFAPGNITDFTAIKQGTDIVLSWTNPDDFDFAKVRVLESENFYPSDIADGWVVYEGGGNEAKSRGKALPGTTHYYTIFTYDAVGNISSGAVAVLRVDALGTVSTSTSMDTIPTATTTAGATTTVQISFAELRFMQEGELIQGNGKTVTVDGAKQLLISIPYGALPEHLKTILVVLTSSEDPHKEFSFLLRVNSAKTEYTAILAPLGVSGDFPFTVTIFDFKTAQVGTVEGVIVSKIRSLHLDDESEDFGGFVLNFISKIGRSYMIWFLILLILLMIMGRRLLRTEF